MKPELIDRVNACLASRVEPLESSDDQRRLAWLANDWATLVKMLEYRNREGVPAGGTDSLSAALTGILAEINRILWDDPTMNVDTVWRWHDDREPEFLGWEAWPDDPDNRFRPGPSSSEREALVITLEAAPADRVPGESSAHPPARKHADYSAGVYSGGVIAVGELVNRLRELSAGWRSGISGPNTVGSIFADELDRIIFEEFGEIAS